jgi:hypothetical protein
MRSKRPTDAASPSWTHTIEPTARVAPDREGETVTAPLDRMPTVYVHVRIVDKTFSRPER